MRLLLATAGLVLATAAAALTAGAAPNPAGFGSASCLRGQWGASQAETKRVLRALAPVPGLEPTGKLYMIFRDGMFQYGTTSLVLKLDLGGETLTARARFFTLQPYTARTGSFTTRGGESTIEYGPMSGTKDGRTYTVPGLAHADDARPGRDDSVPLPR